MHYFRIVPEYWEDRLLKLKACGLNTVETYVPWNLHEEVKGVFNFKHMLDLRRYIQLAQKLGLHVIFRPGPYICSEWDLGGLPSWLLHDPNMKLRSTYKPYTQAVDKFFAELIPMIADLQYSRGGPIIAVQVENEYGSFGADKDYMAFVTNSLKKHGITELLFTSDNDQGMGRGAAPGGLLTVNFQDKKDAPVMFSALRKAQPGKPLMVMEFWTGWFDHWGENHHTVDPEKYMEALEFILKEGSSVNLYMFHGGTNFGFMNGANSPYASDVTSYDYDALLTEHGEVTSKYEKTRQYLLEAKLVDSLMKVSGTPVQTQAYVTAKVEAYLPFETMLSLVDNAVMTQNVMPMEYLDINNGGGQNFGFICYRKKIKLGFKLVLTGAANDRAVILHEHNQIGVVESQDGSGATFQLKPPKGRTSTLDILIENMGRINYAWQGNPDLSKQRKGLDKPVHLDGQVLSDWTIYPMEFKPNYLAKLRDEKWTQIVDGTEPLKSPTVYKAYINIPASPTPDTFLDMREWNKGVVFLNGFNLGRYWKRGPQQTLYVPGPLLHTGANTFLIFELHQPAKSLKFLSKPIL